MRAEKVKIVSYGIEQSGSTPESRLVAAVVIRAFKDLGILVDKRGRVATNRTARHAAVEWVLCKSNQPFTMTWCCSHLGIDYRSLLSYVKEMAPCVREACHEEDL